MLRRFHGRDLFAGQGLAKLLHAQVVQGGLG
jgi:hypothetical protein